jgi:CheY-specific phosphatase CheX
MAVVNPPFPDRKLIEPLFRAIKHVFETNMVRRTQMMGVITPEKLLAISKDKSDEFVISVVKCSGDCECMVAIASPNGLNFVFARDFLEVDDSLLKLGAELPVYRDAAGEINNMLAGTFRNMLSKGQLQLKLTPPIILDGFPFLISSLLKAKSAIISDVKVEEFTVFVFLWT